MLTKFPTFGSSVEENIKSSACCYPDSHLCPVPASTIVNFRLEKSCDDTWQLLVTEFWGPFILSLTVVRMRKTESQIHPSLMPENL